MRLQRTLPGLVVVLLAAGAASAQTMGELRWRSGANPLGLQPGETSFHVTCGSIAFPCDASSVPVYISDSSPRTVTMELAQVQGSGVGLLRPPGMNVSFTGHAALAPALGIYGRVGTSLGGAAPMALASGGVPGAGFSYGVGLSWDISRRASAVVGWDLYDMRTSVGDSRDVRATSLGLQWRY